MRTHAGGSQNASGPLADVATQMSVLGTVPAAPWLDAVGEHLPIHLPC
jgi:hypothetical protein